MFRRLPPAIHELGLRSRRRCRERGANASVGWFGRHRTEECRLRARFDRLLEIESECPDCPEGEPGLSSRCPDCDSVMVYRGIGRLGGGTRVHYYECVHSHREVHSLSIVIAE